MLGAVRHVQQQLCRRFNIFALGVQQNRPYFVSDGGSARFPGGHALLALGFKVFHQIFDLGGLAGPFNALYSNEHPVLLNQYLKIFKIKYLERHHLNPKLQAPNYK